MSLATRPSKNGFEVILQAYSMSMEELSNLLVYASVLGVNHSVVDKTGLTGKVQLHSHLRPSGGQAD